MANTTFISEVKWSGEGVLSVANVNGKEVIIDEPKELGGTDKGANPVEYVLSALGGCINVLVVTFAQKFDVEVNGLDVQLEGDLDPDGFLGINPDVRPGYQEVRYKVNIDSPSPKENIEQLLSHVDAICPVKDTLAGTSVVNVTNQAASGV
ncbi:OsmC family protein [Virgibacillus alimentarius]|uniref:OsmC-like protein n=1 Tax=Virgibacillus alimentarius TaxID=698769 RepID=A0ABS4S9H0_9BACI|nr:OsmC family protein [Virgibacillus alimentarius]MBP2258158.1 putative OsmC-like protein [Virgibacillus alimentarius]